MVSEMPLLGVVNEVDPALLGGGTGYWEIHIFIFPIVSSRVYFPARSLSDVAASLVRLLRQRLDFSTPSQVVVTSGLVGSGRRWSRSDWQCKHSCCRHGDVSVETTRRARALRTRSMSLVLFFYLGSLVKERSSWSSNFWPAHRRVDCESWD